MNLEARIGELSYIFYNSQKFDFYFTQICQVWGYTQQHRYYSFQIMPIPHLHYVLANSMDFSVHSYVEAVTTTYDLSLNSDNRKNKLIIIIKYHDAVSIFQVRK